MQSSKTIFHCTKQYKKTGLKWALNAESTLVNVPEIFLNTQHFMTDNYRVKKTAAKLYMCHVDMLCHSHDLVMQADMT